MTVLSYNESMSKTLPEPHLSLQPSKTQRLAEHGRHKLSMSSAVWTAPTPITKQNDTKTLNHDCFWLHSVDVLPFGSAHYGWNTISSIWSHSCLIFAGEVLPFLSLKETTDIKMFFILWFKWPNHSNVRICFKAPNPRKITIYTDLGAP